MKYQVALEKVSLGNHLIMEGVRLFPPFCCLLKLALSVVFILCIRYTVGETERGVPATLSELMFLGKETDKTTLQTDNNYNTNK